MGAASRARGRDRLKDKVLAQHLLVEVRTEVGEAVLEHLHLDAADLLGHDLERSSRPR